MVGGRGIPHRCFGEYIIWTHGHGAWAWGVGGEGKGTAEETRRHVMGT